MQFKNRLSLKSREDYIPYAVGHVMRSDNLTRIEEVLDEGYEVADPFKHMDREELVEFVENLAFSFSICHANGVPKTLNDAMCALCDVFFNLNQREPASMDEFAMTNGITQEEREFADSYCKLWEAFTAMEREMPKVYNQRSPDYRLPNWHYLIVTDFDGHIEHTLVQADDDEHALDQLDDVCLEPFGRDHVVAMIRSKEALGADGLMKLIKRGMPS